MPRPSDQRPSVRTWLARETQNVHQALHVHPDLLPLANGEIGKHALAALMAKYFAMHEAIERVRERFSWCAELSLACTIRYLLSDLLRLSQARHPGKSFVSLPQNENQCLGSMYVLLGAQFGSQIIG